MTLVVAGVAALAILLIAVGIATSGAGRASPSASSATPPARSRTKAATTGQGGVAELIAQSAALAQLNKVVEQRDFGANLARDLARADLKLKPSEFLAIWAGSIVGVPVACSSCRLRPAGASATRSSCSSARSSASCCRGSGSAAARAAASSAFNKQLPDTITLIANALRAGSSFLQAIELVVRESRPPISTEFGAGHPRGQPRPAVRPGAREHGPPRPVRGPRADGHRHQHPAPGRRQPRRDPRLDRVHDPRARPDQGRDPDPDRPAAAVGLRRRLPADRPGRLPVHRRARSSWTPMFLKPPERPRPPGRRDHPARSAGS